MYSVNIISTLGPLRIVIYLRQRRRSMRLPAMSDLSVCLLARLLKNACIDFYDICVSTGVGTLRN